MARKRSKVQALEDDKAELLAQVQDLRHEKADLVTSLEVAKMHREAAETALRNTQGPEAQRLRLAYLLANDYEKQNERYKSLTWARIVDAVTELRRYPDEVREVVRRYVQGTDVEPGDKTSFAIIEELADKAKESKEARELLVKLPATTRDEWISFIEETDLEPSDIMRMEEALEELGVSRLARLYILGSADVRQGLKAFGLVPS